MMIKVNISVNPNDQNDQVIPPHNNEEIKARREARIAKALKRIDFTHEKIMGDLHGGRTTRKQLDSFSEHHTHTSMVEPKKVFDASIL